MGEVLIAETEKQNDFPAIRSEAKENITVRNIVEKYFYFYHFNVRLSKTMLVPTIIALF